MSPLSVRRVQPQIYGAGDDVIEPSDHVRLLCGGPWSQQACFDCL